MCTKDGWRPKGDLVQGAVVGVKLPQQTCLGVGDTTTTPHLVGVGEVLKRNVLIGIYIYIKGTIIPPYIYYIYWQYSFSQITPNTR